MDGSGHRLGACLSGGTLKIVDPKTISEFIRELIQDHGAQCAEDDLAGVAYEDYGVGVVATVEPADAGPFASLRLNLEAGQRFVINIHEEN
jgi:hypothetical protein